MRVKKAVFPVAGFGSRFLPVTKANPKEMLPIVDKPLIQYAVEEATSAGITDMVFVTSSSKRAIEDHFDNHFELETRLQEQGKEELYAIVKKISPPGVRFTYVRQNKPLGLGHAILCAEHVIGNEPFAVLLADDLIDETLSPCLIAMKEIYESTAKSVLAVQPVAWDQVEKYGVVSLEDETTVFSSILGITEKPKRESAKSNLVAVGRYIFSPELFSCLKQTTADHNGEIQLTQGIQKLLAQDTVHAYLFNGNRYDCGSKLGYLQATVEYGRKHPEVSQTFEEYLKNLKFD